MTLQSKALGSLYRTEIAPFSAIFTLMLLYGLNARKVDTGLVTTKIRQSCKEQVNRLSFVVDICRDNFISVTDIKVDHYEKIKNVIEAKKMTLHCSVLSLKIEVVHIKNCFNSIFVGYLINELERNNTIYETLSRTKGS